MANEFKIKNGVIINDTMPITAITSATGIGDSGNTILTEDAVITYVDTSTQQLSTSAVQFNTNVSYDTEFDTEGFMAWTSETGTASLGMGNGVVQQIGEEIYYPKKTYNGTGVQIDNGTPVMFGTGTGGPSDASYIQPAIATSAIPHSYYLGIATEDIPDGSLGRVSYFGSVNNVNTSAHPKGTILYVSSDTAGEFVTSPPNSPNHTIRAAIVTVQDAVNGRMFVRHQTIPEANEISYDNSESGLVSSNIKSAIDELQSTKASVDLLNSNITMYATTSAGDFGYNVLVTNIDSPAYDTTAVDVSTGAITTTDQLISGLISAPGLFVGNPGVITVPTLGNIRRTSGNGVAHFYFELYKRDSGGTEELLFTSGQTPDISTATYEFFSASGLLNNGTFLDTDRLVIKFYGNRTPGGGDPTYDFQFGGENPVRTNLPVPVSVIPSDDAKDILVDTTSFNNILGGTDDDVQVALDTLDDHNHDSSYPAILDYNTHVGDTTIHFTEASIDHGSISGLLDNDHPQYATSANLESHTGDSTIHFTEASIDHTNISNVGTNTHAQLDTHVADSSIHYTEASIDHGSIGGLLDDDHTQYSLVDGTRAFTGTVGGVTPTISSHLATKGYIDSLINGLSWQEPVNDITIEASATQTTGFRYIASANGSTWTINNVYEWNGSSWDETVTTEGFASWVEDEDVVYTFNGTNWVKIGSTVDHGNLNGLGDDDHTQYFNQTRGDARYALLANGVTNGDSHDHSGGDGAQIDHTTLSNIGTNTHAQLDTHVSDTTIHFTEASIDHGSIGGLLDNDHPQYATSADFVSHTGDSTIHFTEGSIDHTNITNIGTNTHAQLDTHVADTTIHFTEASIDHGSISGLLDNDHPQYALSASLDTKVDKTLFDAHTILIANANDTPIAMTVDSNSFVGRNDSGGTQSLDASEARAVLGNTTAQWNADEIQGYAISAVAPTDGQVLTYNTTSSVWTPKDATGGFSSFNVTGDTGTPETINDGNTLDIAGGTGISTSVGATDTVTINHDAHTGDVTGTTELTIATDAVETSMILNDNVTYAKIQNVVANNVILGNNQGAGSPVDELTASEVRSILNVEDGSQANPELTKSIYIEDPTATDDIGIWEPGVAITITKIVHKTTGSTVTYNINHSGGTDLWSTDEVASTTREAITSFTDATCTAENYIRYQASVIGTTPTSIEITITYTEDA